MWVMCNHYDYTSALEECFSKRLQRLGGFRLKRVAADQAAVCISIIVLIQHTDIICSQLLICKSADNNKLLIVGVLRTLSLLRPGVVSSTVPFMSLLTKHPIKPVTLFLTHKIFFKRAPRRQFTEVFLSLEIIKLWILPKGERLQLIWQFCSNQFKYEKLLYLQVVFHLVLRMHNKFRANLTLKYCL